MAKRKAFTPRALAMVSAKRDQRDAKAAALRSERAWQRDNNAKEPGESSRIGGTRPAPNIFETARKQQVASGKGRAYMNEQISQHASSGKGKGRGNAGLLKPFSADNAFKKKLDTIRDYDSVSLKDARQEFENDVKEMDDYNMFGAGRHGSDEGVGQPGVSGHSVSSSGGKGKGRGNWGHKGRKGLRGGSA